MEIMLGNNFELIRMGDGGGKIEPDRAAPKCYKDADLLHEKSAGT